MPWATSRDEALERSKLLATVAKRLIAAKVDDSEAEWMLEQIAARPPKSLRAALQLAEEVIGGQLPEGGEAVPTFRQVGEMWTSGELHKRYPDQVKAKDSTDDAARLGYLYELDIGGRKLGDVPIDRFTLDHAEAVMRQLPKTARRPGTRRAYAQIINRIAGLAVYPLRLIAASPLPRGFVPKAGRSPAFPYLYPSEDLALMACSEVPLWRRLLWGILDREGPRSGEAKSWRLDVEADTERGVATLDKNKTDDPRAWVMDPGVVRALRAYAGVRGLKVGDTLFADESDAQPDDTALAKLLRADLRAAGVDRAELFLKGENRRPIRAHDLRGTFVTLSLANGKTETWVADRTGHRSSQMINRYRRAARSAAELGLGALVSLDFAIPELSPIPRIVEGLHALCWVASLVDCPGIAHNARSLGTDTRRNPPKSLVGHEGLEPSANGLRVRCSTN